MTEFERMIAGRAAIRRSRKPELSDRDLIYMASAHMEIETERKNLIEMQKRFMRTFKGESK